ncbi:MAG: hypothetical protein K1060chlam5_01122 [Candidatus Anoxychlamydiales bacterium]|nr:hypothetical protein [Candidatus Anoxychlamydiales bacterium]
MFKLLHILFIFIFVIIILNAPENDVLINKLYLNGLIAEKETIHKPTKLNSNKIEKKHDYLIAEDLIKDISLNIDELNKYVFKTNLDLAAINTYNFSRIPKEFFQSFSLPKNFFLQEKNILIEKVDLKDLIVRNETINKRNLLRDDNDIMFENENSFLKKTSFNLTIEKDLNNYLEIKEFETNNYKPLFNSLNFQTHYDSQTSDTSLENYVKSNNTFFPKRSFKISERELLEEKMSMQEKIVKNEKCLIQDEELIEKKEVDSNTIKNKKMIETLHLKDLIANNCIINKTKALKTSSCENNKKEKVLSYADSLLKKPPLVLNDLVEKVLKNNPDLAATKRRIEANALIVPRVQVLEDPLLTVMRHDSPVQSNSPFFTKMRYEASQLLPFPGKLRLKGQIAQQMLEFAQNEEITTLRELVLQTKRLYYQLYLNYAALRINKQNQEIISRFIEDTLTLYKTGEEKYDEVLKAQVEFQLLKKELLNLLSDHDFIVSMINAILDYPQENLIGKPTESFTKDINYSYELLEQIALNNRSELKGIKALVAKQCFKAKLAKRNYFPDFKVMGRYEDRLGRNQSSWGVGVTINVPIWIPQKQRREKREAMKNANAFQKDLEAFEAKIRGKIRDILSKIESTDEKIDLYETGLVPKTSEALLSGEALYKSGKGDFLVLLDTIRQFQDFELEYEAERAQREILLAELERALGVPLEDLTCFISN